MKGIGNNGFRGSFSFNKAQGNCETDGEYMYYFRMNVRRYRLWKKRESVE